MKTVDLKISSELADLAERRAAQRNISIDELLAEALETVLQTGDDGKLSAGTAISNRAIDPVASNLICATEKVLQFVRGDIPLPEVVELWLTNFCNFSCPHCRCAEYHGDCREHFPLGMLAGLLEELAAKGIKTLEIAGGGEPLEHPEIGDVLRLFQEMGFRIGLITNGYALVTKPALLDLILPCADWVRFSLDAVSDDVFRRVHGNSKLQYRELRNVIADMVKRVRAMPGADARPKIGVKYLIQTTNRSDILGAVGEACDLGAHYVQFKFLEGPDPSLVLHQGREEVLAGILQAAGDLAPGRLGVDIMPGYGGPRIHQRCKMSVLHPLVDWDGEIYMCAFFNHRKRQHSLGNIKDRGFFAHWATDGHREKIAAVDSSQCVSNCPLLRYNPVIDFIEREAYRFQYV